MRPLLSICVPTYDLRNGRADRLVKSLTETQSAYSYEIIIEDCAGELRGYTEPMNTAMTRARGHYLLAVNDDVEFTRGWWLTMLKEFWITREHKTWVVTPDARHTDGPQVFHPWCMLWRADAWHAIGGMDEQFVFWCSDIDLARRLVDQGIMPVKVALPTPLRHQLNATSNELPELGAICVEDLRRFREKWGVDAEDEKHRLSALAA